MTGLHRFIGILIAILVSVGNVASAAPHPAATGTTAVVYPYDSPIYIAPGTERVRERGSPAAGYWDH